MVDVKKLTLSFLILATIVSVVSYSLSGPGLYKNLGYRGMAPSKLALAMPNNAFIAEAENMPRALRQNLAGAKTNITDTAAESLAEVIVALNPTGPVTAGGNTGLILPNTTVLTGYLLSKIVENSAFRVTDLWTSPDVEQITLANADGGAANQAYADGFKKILSGTLGSSEFLATLKSGDATGLNDGIVSASISAFGDAIVGLRGLPTPTPFVSFQKSFLAYLENQRNALAVIAQTKTDPLKTLVVLGSGDRVQQQLDGDFKTALGEYRKLDLAQTLSAKPDKNIFGVMGSTVASFFYNQISINTAEAQSLSGLNPESMCGSGFFSTFSSILGILTSLFSFKVPTTDSTAEKNISGNLASQLFNCQDRILTQVAKKNEIDIMNAKTLAYIQGAGSVNGIGDPRFITNYSQTFANAAAEGATAGYQDVSTQICPEFQGLVDTSVFNPANITGGALTGTGTGGGFGAPGISGVPTGCQIKNQVNPTAFYDDFNTNPSAAWDNYFSLVGNPSNNLFGTLAAAHDEIGSAARSSVEAENAQSIANSGFESDVQCLSYYQDPNTGNTICTDEEIVKPGVTTAARTEAAINSDYTGIANANTIAEIDTELADGLSNQLQSNTPAGLANLSFQTGQSLSSVCQSLSIPGITGSLTSMCNNTVGKIINGFTKYINIINTIGSLISSLF